MPRTKPRTVKDTARLFLPPDAYISLLHLIADEGEYVEVPWPIDTLDDWTDAMLDPDERLDRANNPTLDDRVKYAIDYHTKSYSHGEAIGNTILAYPLWKSSSLAEVLVRVLITTINKALRHGIDH